MKNNKIQFCLCLFLGYLGAHKYYEGKILIGLLYTFTVGFLGIAWIVDCIILGRIAFLMSPEQLKVREEKINEKNIAKAKIKEDREKEKAIAKEQNIQNKIDEKATLKEQRKQERNEIREYYTFKALGEREKQKIEDKKAEKQYQKDRIIQLKREHAPYCPKCKSTSLTYISKRKKLSLGRAVVGGAVGGVLTGGLGAAAGATMGGLSSNKMKKGTIKCLNCGHTWKL